MEKVETKLIEQSDWKNTRDIDSKAEKHLKASRRDNNWHFALHRTVNSQCFLAEAPAEEVADVSGNVMIEESSVLIVETICRQRAVGPP